MNKIKLNAIIVLIVFVVMLSGCKKDKKDDTTNNTTNPPPVVEWKYVNKHTIDVNVTAGQIVKDSIYNLTFMFPEDVSGQLEIAPLIKGAPLPIDIITYATTESEYPLNLKNSIEGKGFYINCDKAKNFSLIIPEDTNKIYTVWGFGENSGLMADYTNRENMWVSVPYNTLKDKSREYLLAMPQDADFKKLPPTHPGFTYIYIAAIEKKNIIDAVIREVYINIDLKKMTARYSDSLPPGLIAGAKERMNILPFQFSYNTESIYEPFWVYHGTIIHKCQINLKYVETENAKQIATHAAHESGHYMMHILLGDNLFLKLYRQMDFNTEKHGWAAQTDGRTFYIEESAYFSEYFHTGNVEVSIDLENPRVCFIDNGIIPANFNRPCLEGFGAVMLASLHRTNNKIPDVWAASAPQSVTVPVIGAPFKDIFGILHNGATDIYELRTHIQNYLDSKGKGDLMQPLMCSLGWGYKINLRVYDKNGVPLQGVSVKNLLIAGGREWSYCYDETKLTGVDGKYSITGGVFPGKSTLRFYRGKDYLDYDIDIDWETETNEVVTFDDGSFKLDFANIIPSYLPAGKYAITLGGFYYKCPDSTNYQTHYIPLGCSTSGTSDDIICDVNSTGNVTINFTLKDETCTGSGSIIPVKTVGDKYYYKFNLNFEYMYGTTSSGHKFKGSVTGEQAMLGVYLHNFKAPCSGTMTRYWCTGGPPCTPTNCSYSYTFPEFRIQQVLK